MRFKTCQWIAGEPTPFGDCKCGAPTKDGAPWCADHRKLVYVTLPPGTVYNAGAHAFGASTFRLPLGLSRSAVQSEFDAGW